MDNLIVSPNITIKETIKKLDEVGKKILMVVEEHCLVGVVTDGDIRRWILKNGDFSECVSSIMNNKPKVLHHKNIEQAKKMMLSKKIQAVPIVDYDNRLVDIIFWEDMVEKHAIERATINAPVVIMAGGKGTRLYPYTKVLPKPLIPIGDQTILERIMGKFNEVGCNTLYLTVNYKKSMIKAYLEEMNSVYDINYIEEEKFLGTAGSLFLLKDKIEETFFVSNCDILVDADYEAIYKYHKQNNHKITMVTSLKNYIIPYGIIKTDNKGCISQIEEKPEYNFQVNTGLYVLEPDVLSDIPENTFYHITDLINGYIIKGERVGVYPVMENAWMDMGEIKEMQSMIQRLGTEVSGEYI